MHLTRTNTFFLSVFKLWVWGSGPGCRHSAHPWHLCSFTGSSHPGNVPPMPASQPYAEDPVNCEQARWLLSGWMPPQSSALPLLRVAGWPVASGPPVESSRNARLPAFLIAAQEGQGHARVCSLHPGLPARIAGQCFCFAVCCLFGLTSARKLRCDQMVLKELSAFLGMSDSRGHVSPSLCVCKVS